MEVDGKCVSARRGAAGGIAIMKREVTIAGGGLAGLSLAAGLARFGVPVTVLEAGEYPRHRVCGEFLSGLPAWVAESLGVADLLEDARRHRRVRWMDEGRVFFEGSLPEPALGISRFVLDERLMRRARECGAVVRTGARATPEPREGLVWAAGRRRVRGGRGSWMGVKVHARLQGMTGADLEMRGGTTGYAGLARVEDGWVNVCGLFRTDRAAPAIKGAERLPTLIEAGGDVELAAALREAPWRENSFCGVAGFEFGPQPVTPGLAVIGDSESIVPPFTGHGMAMAFIAAEAAIKPVLAWSAGRASWLEACERLRAALRERFARRLLAAAWMHPVLLSRGGRGCLRVAGRLGLLPFRSLLALVR
jgi:flavin-dependent dehydrogenase